MSLKICTKEEKAEIASRIASFQFSSPYGGDIRKWLRHGIGLHHAVCCRAYRVLVGAAAQAGLLIGDLRHRYARCRHQRAHSHRAVHAVVQVRRTEDRPPVGRDFHQISGRAGRKGFDDHGFVVAQAPEHVIENIRLKEKAARDGKKVTLRKPPEHNFVNWDLQTFKRLMNAQPGAAGLAFSGLARHVAQRAESSATVAEPCSS